MNKKEVINKLSHFHLLENDENKKPNKKLISSNETEVCFDNTACSYILYLIYLLI